MIQFNRRELELLSTNLSAEIMKLEFHYAGKKPKRLEELYGIRDKVVVETKRLQDVNPCLGCDCWDSDAEGCTMPAVDKAYACPLETDDSKMREVASIPPMSELCETIKRKYDEFLSTQGVAPNTVMISSTLTELIWIHLETVPVKDTNCVVKQIMGLNVIPLDGLEGGTIKVALVL